MHAVALTALIAILVVLRQPIVLVLAAGVAYVHSFLSNSSVEFLIQDIWFTLDREVLLSIPLFVFAGLIMARGSIAARLTRVMVELTRPVPGGLGIATVLSLTAFSAISGASAVTMLA